MSTPSVRRNGDGVGHMTSSSYGVTSGQIVGGGGGGTGGWTNKGTEIERIMAKIEQDNRILAELDHNRATTMGKWKIETYKCKICGGKKCEGGGDMLGASRLCVCSLGGSCLVWGRFLERSIKLY